MCACGCNITVECEGKTASVCCNRPRWEDVYNNYKKRTIWGTNGHRMDIDSISFAINSTANPNITTSDGLHNWLLKHWGTSDYSFNRGCDWVLIRNIIGGKYGICIIAGPDRKYATLWKNNNAIDDSVHLGNDTNVYFRELLSDTSVALLTLKRQLNAVPPSSDMDKIAKAGFKIIKDISVEHCREFGATIYNMNGNNQYHITGLRVGNQKMVKQDADTDKLREEADIRDNSINVGIKAFIHTHVAGSRTISGLDFHAGYYREQTIYMMHVKHNIILRADPLHMDDMFSKTLKEIWTCMSKSGCDSCMDSCEDLNLCGINRENCHVNTSTTNLDIFCPYLKRHQVLHKELVTLEKRNWNMSNCLYAQFLSQGQKVQRIL